MKKRQQIRAGSRNCQIQFERFETRIALAADMGIEFADVHHWVSDQIEPEQYQAADSVPGIETTQDLSQFWFVDPNQLGDHTTVDPSSLYLGEFEGTETEQYFDLQFLDLNHESNPVHEPQSQLSFNTHASDYGLWPDDPGLAAVDIEPSSQHYYPEFLASPTDVYATDVTFEVPIGGSNELFQNDVADSAPFSHRVIVQKSATPEGSIENHDSPAFTSKPGLANPNPSFASKQPGKSDSPSNLLAVEGQPDFRSNAGNVVFSRFQASGTQSFDFEASRTTSENVSPNFEPVSLLDRMTMSPQIRELGSRIFQSSVGNPDSDSATLTSSIQANNQEHSIIANTKMPDVESGVLAVWYGHGIAGVAESNHVENSLVFVATPIQPLTDLAQFDIFAAVVAGEVSGQESSNGHSRFALVGTSFAGVIAWIAVRERIGRLEWTRQKSKFVDQQGNPSSNACDATVRAAARWAY